MWVFVIVGCFVNAGATTAMMLFFAGVKMWKCGVVVGLILPIYRLAENMKNRIKETNKT